MPDRTSTDGTEGAPSAKSNPVAGQLLNDEACEPRTIGRYEVVRQIGSGGMGVVFEAVDPSLNRRIALKLVQVSKAPQRRQGRLRKRLLREAHALAQLNHPNVVTIFEFGRHEADVFIALEFVQGRTAADWVLESEPSVAEILDVYLAAGEGLAAAHRAGILHRDFKPQNIIVGDDGRVRVIDFGLARFETADSTPAELETLASGSAAGVESNFEALLAASTGVGPDSPHPAVIDSITRRGALLGTPRYMSPEQQLLEPADARSDQYSFCASLYEALAGVPPHYRGGWEAPVSAELRRPFREPLRDVKIPAWLLSVLHRGAHPAPQHRYPSVDALLSDLRKSTKRSTGRRYLLAALGVLSTTLLWAASHVFETPHGRCAAGAERGPQIWSADITSRLEKRLVSTRSLRAQEVWSLVQRRVSSFESQWTHAYGAACDDTFVRGVQTETGLDSKLSCLDARARRTRGLLVSAATSSNITSESLLDALPTSLAEVASVGECGASDGAIASHSDLETRERFDALARDIESLQDEKRLRPSPAALADAQALVARARLGGFEVLEVEARLLVASLKSDSGEYKEAFKLLTDVVDDAARMSRADVLIDALTKLVSIEGYALERYDPALSRFQAVRAMVALLQVPPQKVAVLEMMGAVVYQRKGQLEDARTHFEASRALLESLPEAPKRPLMQLYNNLGTLLRNQGELEQASTYLHKSLSMAKEMLGERHPTVASILNNVANLEGTRGNFESQTKLIREAESVARVAFGEDHPSYVWIKYNVASIAVQQRRYDDALSVLPAVRAQFAKVLGEDHVAVAQTDLLWGFAHRDQGHCELAVEHFSTAIDHMREHDLDGTAVMAEALVGRAICGWSLGLATDARRDTSEARELQTQSPLLTGADERWLLLAEAYMAAHVGAPLRANELFKRACDLKDDDGDALGKACTQLRAQLGDDSLGTLPQRAHE